ncbi:hypothetical protein BH20VER1_BH20VER1_01150 [soil metagenome]
MSALFFLRDGEVLDLLRMSETKLAAPAPFTTR